MKTILKRYVHENRKGLLALFLLAVSVVVVSLAPPQILRVLIDTRLTKGITEDLPAFAACYLVVLILNGGLDFLKGVALTGLGQKLIRDIRMAMYRKATRLKECYYTEHGTGETVAYFTSDVDSVNSLFTDGLISMFIDGMKIIGILISVWMFHLGLFVLLLSLIVIIAVITRVFQVNMKKAQKANLKEMGGLSNYISESMENLQIVRLLHKEHYLETTYEDCLQKNYNTKRKVNTLDSVYAPIIQFLRAAAVTIIILLCAKDGNVAGITAGMLAASIEFLGNLIVPIEALGMEFQKIQQGISGIHRLEEFLSLTEEEKDESITAQSILGEKEVVDILIEDVDFSYNQKDNVLEGIHLHIPPCGNVTFTGRTGAGKSTLMKLILGLYSPTKGRILLNGVRTDRIPHHEKRRIFGYVEQTFHFIPGSVAEQISLGDTAISQEEIEKVCVSCGLDSYIHGLKDGYDTIVTDGSEFSFGQRQLLSIARAVVSNPKILLLDEITANLDSATEKVILDTLKNACTNRTIISISHRLAAVDPDTEIFHIN